MSDFRKCKPTGRCCVDSLGRVWDVELNHYLGRLVSEDSWRYVDCGTHLLSLDALAAINMWLKHLNQHK
jgi:hypothetical protein